MKVATLGLLASCCVLSMAKLRAQAGGANQGSSGVLHGRVKDEQCAVLGRLVVRVRGLASGRAAAERTVTTDAGGNYTIALEPGTYQVCIAREKSTTACSTIDMPDNGDKWMTTQMRATEEGLSTFGNHAY